MTPMIIEHHGSRRAYILQTDGEETIRLATVFKMADGWHAKLSDDHTGRAWSGPFGSAEEAMDRFSA